MLNIEYKTREDLERILNDFRILFAYHSNRIENEETDYQIVKEVFEKDRVSSFNGDPRTLFEIQNQKKCYELLLDKMVNREPVTIDLIKEVHKTLTEGTYDETRYNKGERPGEFKKGDYIVGKDEIGSDAEDVEKDLNELLEEINESDSSDYLTIAAYFHLRFESIHPFADGNGRVGRTLLNYYLIIHDIRPLIVYDEDKKIYYECLQAYDHKEDIEPLKKFLKYSQEKTWKKKKKDSVKKLCTFV
ncbi:MAG: Fic family protein [Erysipelotrichaceae bacterium]|nr:Fic family protein [Erysipelotrichaceae bacterium]